MHLSCQLPYRLIVYAEVVTTLDLCIVSLFCYYALFVIAASIDACQPFALPVLHHFMHNLTNLLYNKIKSLPKVLLVSVHNTLVLIIKL